MVKSVMNKDYPKISVVTPNYNQDRFLEQTIKSVLDQGYPNLEYIVIDGKSTDNSVAIIKKYESQLHYWISEKDNGMYDAINKGFLKATGSIMCWINSDDLLAEKSLFKVAEVFNNNPNVNWLMGYPTIINEQNEVTWQGQDAKVFNPLFFYLHNHARDFSFIQQESTFWRRSIWEQAGGRLNTSYSLAADFDLWLRFFRNHKLYFYNEQLSAFRKRKGQQSENQDIYIAEANKSVKDNEKRLFLKDKLNIFLLKSIRKVFFMTKIKSLRNTFYEFQNRYFGKPTIIN